MRGARIRLLRDGTRPARIDAARILTEQPTQSVPMASDKPVRPSGRTRESRCDRGEDASAGQPGEDDPDGLPAGPNPAVRRDGVHRIETPRHRDGVEQLLSPWALDGREREPASRVPRPELVGRPAAEAAL